MLMMQACPRCQGTISRDLDGDLSCIQCGWSGPVRTAVPVDPRADGTQLEAELRRRHKRNSAA
ncbi:MAG: hypothetical protein HY329_17610 [Chloroflexi bacterium]|nr:hypothetical protein [Chloroflexota bacterium]